MNRTGQPDSHATLIQLRLVAAIISVVWLAVALAILFAWIGFEDWLPYTLGHPKGLLPIQLVTFSFIHVPAPWFYWIWNLTVHLLWLWGLVNIAAGRLNLIGFVRIYSLGTIGAGVLWILVARLAGWTEIAADPGVVIGAFVGVMAVYAPQDEVFIWGEQAKTVISNVGQYLGALFGRLMESACGCWVVLWLLTALGSFTWLGATGLLLAVCPFAWLVVACLPCRLWVVAAIWLGLEFVRGLLVLARGGAFPAMHLLMTALALGAGAAYGGVERWWHQKPDRWKS